MVDDDLTFRTIIWACVAALVLWVMLIVGLTGLA
jgi:hypothetical protein